MKRKKPMSILLNMPHEFWLGLEYAREKAGVRNRTLFIRTLIAEGLQARGVPVEPQVTGRRT